MKSELLLVREGVISSSSPAAVCWLLTAESVSLSIDKTGCCLLVADRCRAVAIHVVWCTLFSTAAANDVDDDANRSPPSNMH